MENYFYVIDITKPPVGPPGRIFRQGLFFRETKESKKQTKRWNIYIEQYHKELIKSREKQ